MPGHTTLWRPDQFIFELRRLGIRHRNAGEGLEADVLEGAARMIYQLDKYIKEQECEMTPKEQ